ncbi:hypothetical protein VCHC41A1_0224, partial [Vibrio cholerae HC-41A1]
MGKLAEYPLF